jgi:hypothetical protein
LVQPLARAGMWRSRRKLDFELNWKYSAWYDMETCIEFSPGTGPAFIFQRKLCQS